MDLDAALDDLSELLFAHLEVYFKVKCLFGVVSVNEAEILGDMLVEYYLSYRSVYYLLYSLLADLLGNSYPDSGVYGYDAVLISHESLVEITENLTLAHLAGFGERKIVRAEYHILSGDCYRSAVGGLQEVLCCEHKRPCLILCFLGERQMNSHLVAVKVRVERRTYERMQLYRASLDKHGGERLYTQTVQGRRTVEQYGMILDNVLQHVPYLVLGSVHHFSRALYIV